MPTNLRFLRIIIAAGLSFSTVVPFGITTPDPARAEDSTEAARALSRQVSDLISARNLRDAEQLASKGLALCNDAGEVKSFCSSQFNDSLGDIAFLQGKYADSLPYYQKSLEIRQGSLPSDHTLILGSQVRLGRTYLALHRLDEAEARLKVATDGLARVAPASPNAALAFRLLRQLYQENGRLDEEVATTRRELEIAEKYVAKPETIRISKILLNTALLKQAKRLSADGNDSAAEAALIESIRLIDPPQAGDERYLAVSLAGLGTLYSKLKRYAEAEQPLLRALDLHTRFPQSPDPSIPADEFNLAALYQDWDKPDAALPHALQAISKLDEAGTENPTLGFALLRLGQAYRSLGRRREAERPLLRAKDVLDRVLPENDTQRVVVRAELGSLLIDLERFDEAQGVLQSALEIASKLPRSASGWHATVLGYLGLAYREQGHYAEAERSISEAIQLNEAAGQERVVALGQRLEDLASIFRRENRYAEAEAALLRSLSLEQPAAGRAAALNQLGLVYTSTNRYAKAETVLNEALAIRSKLLPPNSILTAETIANLATVDSSRGRFAEAEIKLRHTLEMVSASGLSQTTNTALYSSLLSQSLMQQGKLDEAEALIQLSVEIYRQKLGVLHPRYGGALKTLAAIEALRRRDADAEAHYQEALAIDESTVGPQSPAVAADLIDLVPLLERVGNWQAARANVDRATEINTANFGADSTMNVDAILAAATMAFEQGEYTQARQLTEHVRQIQEQAFGPDHYRMMGSWIFGARIDIAQDKLDEAAGEVDRAAHIAATLSPDHVSNIDILETRADLARALGKSPDAERDLRDALVIAERSFDTDHPVRRNAIDRLTGVLWVEGKFADAEGLQRAELAANQSKRGSNHPSTANALRGLAGVLSVSGQQDEAIKLYRRAISIDESCYGPTSDQVARSQVELGSVLRRLGRFDEARNEINLSRHAWEARGNLLAANSSLTQLALLALDQGSPAEAVVFLEQTLSTAEAAFGPDSPALVADLAQLGRFYIFVGRDEAAEKILTRIKHLVGDDPPEQTPGYLDFLQLRATLSAERSNVDAAEADFIRGIAIATQRSGSQTYAVASNSYNLAALYLRTGNFQKAIESYLKALAIFKRENGDHSPTVGYTLAGAAQAYAKIGDQASSKALFAAAADILGPTFAAQRPQPNWL